MTSKARSFLLMRFRNGKNMKVNALDVYSNAWRDFVEPKLGISTTQVPNSSWNPNISAVKPNSSLINETFGLDNDSLYDQYTTNQLIYITVTSVVLCLLILATVIGNVFVIAAILLERNLRTAGNYLVLSLAVADLMVACLVMPLGAVYEVTQEWLLGPELCDMWTCCDVLCCTASILHLLAIAIDRYWAVTNVDYIQNRNARRIVFMIVLVWAIAFVVSIAPIFGWKDPEFQHRVQVEKRCLVSQDVGYQIFATFSTFYVPLILVLLLYWRIWQEARKRIRRKPGHKAVIALKKTSTTKLFKGTKANINSSNKVECETTTFTTIPNESEAHIPTQAQPAPDPLVQPSPEKSSSNNGMSSQHSDCGSRQEILPSTPSKKDSTKSKLTTRESLEAKRERKAAKTLAIITGVFVICWLPFFVVALLMPLCTTCASKIMFAIFLWLGYLNSMLNPIIYTIFSPDFRSAFKKMLFGKQSQHRNRH